MEINQRKIGDFCFLDLPADVFSKTKIEFLKSAVEDILEEGFTNLMFNMSQICKIDGTAIGILLNVQKSVLFNNANMRLYNLQPYVANILYQTRMNKIFEIVEINNEMIDDFALLNNSLIA